MGVERLVSTSWTGVFGRSIGASGAVVTWDTGLEGAVGTFAVGASRTRGTGLRHGFGTGGA